MAGSTRRRGLGPRTNLTYLRDLVRYWGDGFDWRRAEHHVNTFSHFAAIVRGQRIHFIHECAKEVPGLPVIVTHGWPGAFAEMTKLIPLRTSASDPGDPAFALSSPRCPATASQSGPRGPACVSRQSPNSGPRS